MKTLILILASIVICTCAEAQNCGCCDCYLDARGEYTNFYGAVVGGPSFLQTKNQRKIKPNFKTGYIVSGSYGYRWCYGIRIEAEYAFRWNLLRNVRVYKKNFDVHGNFQSSSYMGNLLWDIPFRRGGCDYLCFQPYFGAGIGYDFQKIHVRHKFHGFDKKKQHFAWQLMAGFLYPIACDIDLMMDYKFHRGGFSHIKCHSLEFGFTYTFGLRY